jgi:hypothetical protein
MNHAFIAHVEEDADVALGIALGLEEAGYRTWCYEVDSVVGTSYIVQTGEALAQSDAVVAIISPHSLSSNQVTKETSAHIISLRSSYSNYSSISLKGTRRRKNVAEK